MTPAERQRRRRQRLRAERKAAQRAEKQAKNAQRLKASEPQRRAAFLKWEANQPPPEQPLEDRADEIAAQLDDVLALEPDLTIEDILAAIHRRRRARLHAEMGGEVFLQVVRLIQTHVRALTPDDRAQFLDRLEDEIDRIRMSQPIDIGER